MQLREAAILKVALPAPDRVSSVYFEGAGFVATPIYLLPELQPGSVVVGPAILIDNTQTIVLVPDAEARVLASCIVIDLTAKQSAVSRNGCEDIVNPIQLSIFGHQFMSVAEQASISRNELCCDTELLTNS